MKRGKFREFPFTRTGVSFKANNNKYAIQVFMNNGNWYCAGSSGRKSEHNYTLGFNNSSPGCIDNP